jgi:hypothetical protein
MHAQRESCFAPAKEEAAHVLQAFDGTTSENLQHQYRPEERSPFQINGFRVLHGRLLMLRLDPLLGA